MASATATQESASTLIESAEDFQETKRLEEAAKNNRLHKLPHELLWMIVDYLDYDDIGNLSDAMTGPYSWDFYDLDLWLFKRKMSRFGQKLEQIVEQRVDSVFEQNKHVRLFKALFR